MVLGVIYMIYLYRTNPGRVTDVGLVHLDALEETTWATWRSSSRSGRSGSSTPGRSAGPLRCSGYGRPRSWRCTPMGDAVMGDAEMGGAV